MIAHAGCHLDKLSVVVSSLSEGGSAKKDGLKVGSILVAVDELPVSGLELQHVRNMIVGGEGTPGPVRLMPVVFEQST